MSEGTPKCFTAYYYELDSTVCAEIDAILKQVAAAGKGFHHTEGWNDELSDGTTYITRIQAAAIEAAAELAKLRAEDDAWAGELAILRDYQRTAAVTIDTQAAQIAGLAAQLKAARAIITAMQPIIDDVVDTVSLWQHDPSRDRHPAKLGWTPSKSRCGVAYAIFDAVDALRTKDANDDR